MQALKNRYTDAGFALKKAFIDNQSQCKKLEIFFYFPFFCDRPTLQILKKIRALGNKIGLALETLIWISI